MIIALDINAEYMISFEYIACCVSVSDSDLLEVWRMFNNESIVSQLQNP